MEHLLFESVISRLGSESGDADKEAMNYEELLEICDQLIKAGKIPAVAQKIQDMNFSQVPRKYRQTLGKLCRRSGLIDSGLRLLHPIIRHEKSLEIPASPGEICEYSVLLSRNGSIQEALTLLEAVDPAKAPEALLYKGFCHVSNWNYQQAAAEFENFLASPADGYSKLIARVNLASAYIFNGQWARADEFLNETIAIARESQATRLIGNCFELRGQLAFFRRDFSLARSDLKSAHEIFSQSGSYDQLLIHKWQAAIQAFEASSLEPLLIFRHEALQKSHWESVRDSDFHQLKLNYDQKVFDHLIYGTPSKFFCSRVQRELSCEPSESYIFGHDSSRILDLQTGQLPGADKISGTKVHQLISALLRDFYAPSGIGKLFSDLYPEEYFNIETSADRVRQVIKRARHWLEKSQVPAQIEESRGQYKFIVPGDFGVQISIERGAIDIFSAQWQDISRTFIPGEKFTAETACQRLQISRTSFHRLSVWAIERKLLIKSGCNKATVYEICEGKFTKAS